MKALIKRISVSVLPVLMVAGLGSLFVNLGMDFYRGLAKPSEWIPAAVIPIAWTIIYSISAVILFMWRDISKSIAVLFIINGLLNVLWCLFFFTLELTFVGAVVIILNLIAGFYLVTEIKKVKVPYFYALALYPIWLSVATALNIAVWILN